jgi:putative SOS response-associated peptidase YedK
MCGRFSQSERTERLAAMFGAEPDRDLPSGNYNVAPTDSIRMVVEREGRRLLTAADWGFRPFWRDRARRVPGWINAKAETAAESRAFGAGLRQRRCVIPADAFYEWDRGPGPPQPYAIGPTDGRPFAFAGIWTDANGDQAATTAIVTIGANPRIGRLHHRMPVILAEIDAWLASDTPPEHVMAMLQPAPDDAVRIWAVSTAVNSVRNDGPELLEPLEDAFDEHYGSLKMDETVDAYVERARGR